MSQPDKSRPDAEPVFQKILEPEAVGLFQDILNSGSSLRVKVTGRSMAPFLRGGDSVTMKNVSCSTLCRGDLIFYKNGRDQPMLHRIVRKRKNADETIVFRTKGDALIALDEPVSQDRLLGKVYRIEKTDSKGRSRCMELESIRYRGMNYLVAMTSLIKSLLYYGLSRFKRRLHPFLQHIMKPGVSAMHDDLSNSAF